MQRILSVEASRTANQPNSEFVTKRFCWSFLLTVAFFAILGGFLLGKFVSDRTVDDMTRQLKDLHREVGELNANLQDTFNSGLNATTGVDYPFLQCNFVVIGANQSNNLQSVTFLRRLNQCFGG